MIVRINQLSPAAAEQAAGWDVDSVCGPIERGWPSATYAYQVLVLDRDEQQQPLSDGPRREQIRQMLPQVIDALSDRSDQVIVRIDGPLCSDGVVPAFMFAGNRECCRRFSYSAAEWLADRDEPPVTSIRLLPRPECLAEICIDPRISLHEKVRLRAFGLAGDELVDPMLDTADLEDERWRELLSEVSFMVSTSRDMLSLLICTPRFDADQTRLRITRRLGGKGV
jgi:hypothetical protein